MFSLIAWIWRWLRAPFLLAVGVAIGFLAPYLYVLDRQVRSRFDDLSWQIPSRVYARPLTLGAGLPLDVQTLTMELEAARYRDEAGARQPGTYERSGSRFVIARRAFVWLDGRERERRIAVTLTEGRVARVADADSGEALGSVRLEPARIATLYGSQQEERRILSLGEAPPLLVAGLQAVEDRDFKDHHGIDSVAIARAAWANLRAGRVVQGGSTLTQQLVRNLFLDRSQNLLRKLNEVLIALLIEARYDKRAILEAYVNEVFLGQQGGQAVHGFAAASEFWFGRDVRSLGAADIALLVGLVQGPSYHDPRRYPQRAMTRRNRVLAQFYETGLIDEKTLTAAQSQPLHVSATGALPRNRYPAFLDLVRAQLQRDYPDAELDSAGLAIHTTLAPSTQRLAEAAVGKAMAALGTRGDPVEAAVVVTGARDGDVQALIGGRNPDEPGFNRALTASRPIGSLIKPFVFLVALAQPQRYSLASLIDDAPVDLPQRDGSRWRPKNDDGLLHGEVPLADVLANSWNLATVQLGLRVGVDRVRGLVESFGLGRPINPNPSLLLGAVELSPFDVAQLYQYFAADGHAVPLRALRGVLDAQGRPLARYETRSGTGDYVAPSRLVTHALQQAAREGTGRTIVQAGLGHLAAAGKTGTSDTQRDSWFAGYTGSHLAVAWVGRDDNKPTGLYGSTGALRIWIELFRQLPSTSLTPPRDGLEWLWIDPPSGRRTDAACADARQVPFIAGYGPTEERGCALDRLRQWLGGDRADSEEAD